MKKKTKVILVCIILVVLAMSALLIYKFAFNKKEEKPPVTNVSTVTNKIDGYDYTLEDRDTALFGTIFKTLKDDLENVPINQEIYAKAIAEMFIIDLYTIDNKISRYDIGGLEYMYQEAKESFRSKVLDSIYLTVEDNSYKTRKQLLPIVETIEVIKLESTTYTIGNEKKDAYTVSLKWTYKEDLGYDNNGIVTLIKNDKKIEVVAYAPSN